jgi:hypothetical protein
MTKMKKILFLLLTAITVFTSCEKVVDVDLPKGETALVIESKITNMKELWEVKLSLSQPYLDQGEKTIVDNAVVNIKGTDGTDVNLNHFADGVYLSDDSLSCIPGETYTLTVEHRGRNYTASETAPNGFPLDIIQPFFLPNNNGFIQSGFYLFIQGPQVTTPGAANYFWKFYKNDTLQESFLLVENDEFGEITFLNPSIDSDNPLGRIDENIFPRPFPFLLEIGDSIRLEQFVLSQRYYQYIVDLDVQRSRSGTPFDPPPANPRNNLSNGALGYFAVAHKYVAFAVVD